MDNNELIASFSIESNTLDAGFELSSTTEANKDLSNLSDIGEERFTSKQDKINDLDSIRQGAQKGLTALQEEVDPLYTADKPYIALKSEIPDVSNFATKTEVNQGLTFVENKIPTKVSQLNNDSQYITSEYHDNTKQNVISDLDDIREGSQKGATAYQKPESGIRRNDLNSDVKESLSLADSALQSVPSEYVTESELEAKGYTKNIGTITSIKMNGQVKGTYDMVDLGTVLTEHQDLSDYATKYDLTLKQDKGNYALKTDIPTYISYFTNDAGYLTQHQDISNLATKSEVNAKQDKLTAGQNITIENNVISATGGGTGRAEWGYIEGTLSNQTDLKNALDGKQATLTAGTGIDITNNVISNTQTSAEWGNITGTLDDQTDLKNALDSKQPTGNYALTSQIPTNNNQLTNGAGYQTALQVQQAIAQIPQFSVQIVEELPTTGQKMVLYLLPKTSASGDDIYDEYIWVESTSTYELVGSTTVDLSDYYTKTATDELLELKQDKLTSDNAGANITISEGSSGVPSGYTQLTYVQSSGSQYIDTGIIPAGTDTIIIRYKHVSEPATTGTTSFFGLMPGKSVIIPRFSFGISAGKDFVGYNSTNPLFASNTDWHTVTMGHKSTGYYTKYDNITESIYTITDTTQPSLTAYIFARHGSSGVDIYDGTGTAISYIDWYSDNGTHRAKFVACQRDSDNALGFYDAVNGNFITTTGLTGGEVISSSTLKISASVPSKTSQLTNDSNFITSSYHDSTKQDTISDLATIRSGASLGATALQSVPSEYVTETELSSYHDSTKQDTLVSGTSIKTINNQTLLGSGNITIEGGGTGNYVTTDTTQTITGEKTFNNNVTVDLGSVPSRSLKVKGSGGDQAFLLERTSGATCVLEAGGSIGLFGTKTQHPIQIRTAYTNRMTIGTDGSVTLATAPASTSNNNQLATTKWVRDFFTNITGYSSSNTQTLKNVNGTLKWVND